MNNKKYFKRNEVSSLGKAQLKDILNPVPVKDIQKVINKIISETRKIDLSIAKSKRIVFRNEAILILDHFGCILD